MSNNKLMQDILNHPEHINLIYTPHCSSMFYTANHIYGHEIMADVVHVGASTLFFMMEEVGSDVINDWYNTGADFDVLPKILEHITSITVQPFFILHGDTDCNLLTVYAISKHTPKRTLVSKVIEGFSPAGRLVINQSSWQVENRQFNPDMFSLTVKDFDDEDAIFHSIDGVEIPRRWGSSISGVDNTYQEIEESIFTTLQ